MTVMSRQAMFEAAWQRPLTEIADDFGITSTGLKKICDRHDIPTPGRGYWAQVRAGETFPRPALRPVNNPRLEEVRVLGARPLPPAVAAAIRASRLLGTDRRKARLRGSPAAPSPPGAEPMAAQAAEAKTASPDHKDLAATRRALSRARRDGDGFASVSGAGIIPTKVGLASHPSALAFLTALTSAAEARGWSLQSTPDRARMMVEGELVAFRWIGIVHQREATPKRAPRFSARKCRWDKSATPQGATYEGPSQPLFGVGYGPEMARRSPQPPQRTVRGGDAWRRGCPPLRIVFTLLFRLFKTPIHIPIQRIIILRNQRLGRILFDSHFWVIFARFELTAITLVSRFGSASVHS